MSEPKNPGLDAKIAASGLGDAPPSAVIHAAPRQMALETFLLETPPAEEREVVLPPPRRLGAGEELVPPDLLLHCDQPTCVGERMFNCTDRPDFHRGKWGNHFLTYRCRNCGRGYKGYSLRIYWPTTEAGDVAKVRKYGEIPEFGAPLPDALTKLVEDDRALLNKGYKSENQGLGIAANAYYRRVVENQKNAILQAIRKVAEQEQAGADVLQEIDAAIAERQFSKAVEKMKHGIPRSLQIDGHDPLTLLHDELSVGVHELSDQECLESAQHIRILLADLADRTQQALKNRQAVKGSLNALLAKQRERNNRK